MSETISNENYSKVNLILEAVRAVIVGDNSNTGKTVREMDYYIGDRIRPSRVPIGTTFPQCTMVIDSNNLENLPTGIYMLNIRTYVEYDYADAIFTLNNISQRLDFLLSGKHLNLNNSLSGDKKLKCRKIYMLDSIDTFDDAEELHIKHQIFHMICDNEYVNN